MSIRQISICVLIISVFLFRNTNCQTDSKCVTPNGEDAFCISVYSCKVITDAILTGDKGAIEFAKQSSCGYARDPLVCCGSTGYHTGQDIFEFFTKAPEETQTLSPEDQTVILSDFKTQDLPDRTVCGLEGEIDKIVSGKITKLFEFPWIAALEYVSKLDGSKGGIRCGGSIINNRYILTAAHCMDSTEFRLVNVRLGEWKLSTNPDCIGNPHLAIPECNDPVEIINIEEQIPHSFYSNGNNDIGLLKLERPFNFTKFIRPICLPPFNLPSPIIGTRFSIAGWGLINETGVSSDYKLKVDVPLTANSDCKKLSLDRIVSANQFCAGGEGSRDSCEGDSGGPLMRKYQDRANKQTQWYLEGVVSWGEGCGRDGKPAVYTKVSRYINWILRQISEDFNK